MKLYKFNMEKNEHNLFLIKNRLFNIASDTNEEKDWKKYYEFLDLYEYMQDHKTSYYFSEVPYEYWLKATEASHMACEIRAQMNREF